MSTPLRPAAHSEATSTTAAAPATKPDAAFSAAKVAAPASAPLAASAAMSLPAAMRPGQPAGREAVLRLLPPSALWAPGSTAGTGAQPPLPLHELPARELFIEQIAAACRMLDDPHAQPELRALPFSPETFRFGRSQRLNLPLWGKDGRIDFRQVRFDLDSIGAALASLAAVDPQAILAGFREVQAAEPAAEARDVGALYQVRLRLQRRGSPALDGGVDLVLDSALPTDGRGRLLGQQSSGALPVRAAAWPYVLAKSLLKLFAVMQANLAPDAPSAAAPGWEEVIRALCGRSSRRIDLRDPTSAAPARALLQAMASSLKPSQTPGIGGRPGSVIFAPYAELGSGSPLRGGRVQPTLGETGLRVQLLGGILDMVLLCDHPYSIVGFDRLEDPTWVHLYNPLGYNPQATQSVHKVRRANFFVPEDLALMPKAQGTLRLPVAALLRLGRSLHVAE